MNPFLHKRKVGFVLILVFAGLYGCAHPPAENKPEAISPVIFSDQLPHDSFELAVSRQLQVWRKMGDEARHRPSLTLGERKFSIADAEKSLQFLAYLLRETDDPRYLSQRLPEYFDFFPMSGKTGKGDVLMTGYYHPLIQGSLVKSPDYPYPLYRLPDDMVFVDLGKFKQDYKGKRLTGRLEKNSLLPYFDRRQIDQDLKLQHKGLELAYVASDLDRFFLQIQGSGSLILPNNQLLPVHYDGQNGHPYEGIGGKLVQDGLLSQKELSMPAIRDLLEVDGELREKYLLANPSYVFFRKGDGEPKGAGGVIVTPWRSMAVDRELFPLGLPAFSSLYRPSFDEHANIANWQKTSGFLISQDTGGAIKGPGRVDFYTGSGELAQKTAGSLAHYVEVTFLLLKEDKLATFSEIYPAK